MESNESQAASGDSLKSGVARLISLGRQLRVLSTQIAVTMIIHLTFGIGVMAFQVAANVRMNSLGFATAVLIDMILFLIVAALLLIFDWNLSSGNALFQEISDEVEWFIGRGGESVNRRSAPSDRPGLELRLALREFNQATRLPLIQNSGGLVQYFFLGFVGLIVNFVVFTLVPRYI